MDGGIVVVGHDHLAEQVIQYLNAQGTRKLWAMDPLLDEDLTHYMRNVEILRNSIDRLESFTNFIDLSKITQIFFCWKEDNEASTAVYLAQRIHAAYPNIKIYVRVFDEKLAKILTRIGVTTFSTTDFAFSKLQDHVEKSSGIL